VLENVVLKPGTNDPDYESEALTENTRAAYPVDFIDNAVIPGIGGHPKTVIFLTADAFGVLPPISKLTTEQAMYHFLSGYTAKVAGTEAGVKEPTATFSTCFGAPFMILRPKVYAELLGKRLEEHTAQCWLVNTGWSGGGYGVGKRMSLKYTRAMVTAAVNGSLLKAEFATDSAFGLTIPKAVPGVPSELLKPAQCLAGQSRLRQSRRAPRRTVCQKLREVRGPGQDPERRTEEAVVSRQSSEKPEFLDSPQKQWLARDDNPLN